MNVRSFSLSAVGSRSDFFPCLTSTRVCSASAAGWSWDQAAPSHVRRIPRPWAQPADRPGRPAHQYFLSRPSGRWPYLSLGSLARHNEASSRGMWESVLPCTPTSTSSAPPVSPLDTSGRHPRSALLHISCSTPPRPPPSHVSSRQQAQTSQLDAAFPQTCLCFIFSEAWYHSRSGDKNQILPMTAGRFMVATLESPCVQILSRAVTHPLLLSWFSNEWMLLWVIGVSLISSTGGRNENDETGGLRDERMLMYSPARVWRT